MTYDKEIQKANDTFEVREMAIFYCDNIYSRYNFRSPRKGRIYEVIDMRLKGNTYKEIGERMGYSTTRARDICFQADRRIKIYLHEKKIGDINGLLRNRM